MLFASHGVDVFVDSSFDIDFGHNASPNDDCVIWDIGKFYFVSYSYQLSNLFSLFSRMWTTTSDAHQHNTTHAQSPLHYSLLPIQTGCEAFNNG